ncbi:2OG-Fe(II) oxygenase family protein [Streptomyces noursei]|uniref:2OG-Fe(II) oxygenase family protein n=1 Tax=Streptomyces noursei TaxID=1971 RepID=UPI003820F391
MHTDFGSLTILYQEDDRGGLQVLQVLQGKDDWRDVSAIPGSFVVNIGDLMALWTGGRWVSTLHRVINPERGDTSSRVTIPFLYLPNHDAMIEPHGVAKGRRPIAGPCRFATDAHPREARRSMDGRRDSRWLRLVPSSIMPRRCMNVEDRKSARRRNFPIKIRHFINSREPCAAASTSSPVETHTGASGTKWGQYDT